jgi:hypothetical protein
VPLHYAVRQGDCITSIAEQFGHFWTTIWEHPGNAGLKAARKDPNTLVPGDIVFVPDVRPKQEARATDAKHRFRKRGIPAICRIQVFDEEEPRANQAYRFQIDGRVHEGTTDEDGVLEVPLPPRARSGKLTIGEEKAVYHFVFGVLEPVDTVRGAQIRLANLGFYRGRDHGVLDEATHAALLAFQYRFELEQTGELDGATQARLLEIHDDINQYEEPEAAGHEQAAAASV